MSRQIPKHGTSNRYARGCRCTPCTKAATRADAERKLARLAGKPRQIPAGPAVERVRALLARGLTNTQVARESGLQPSTIRRLADGQKTILAVNAEKILSVPLDVRVSLGDVPSVGAVRRVRALYALGHLNWVIAEEAGISRDTVGHLAAGDWPTLKVGADDGVRAAYDRLSMRTGTSWKTRRLAERRGWAPPLAWDDDTIDEPNAAPMTDAAELAADDYVDQVAVIRFVRGFAVDNLQDAELIEAIRQCAAAGMTYPAIDALRGWEKKTTEKHVNRIRKQYQRAGQTFPEPVFAKPREFTEPEVVAIRERSAAGASDVLLAVEFDVARETIRSIVRGQRYAQYGGPVRGERSAASKRASRHYMCGHTSGSRAALKRNEMGEAA